MNVESVMRKQALLVVGLVVVALAGGYWLGRSNAGHEPAASAATEEVSGGGGEAAERKILYYRNPMGLADTSPAPKKDSMGMDYIPVYEGDEPDGPQVKISLSRLQKLGVRTEAIASRVMDRTVRAVGTVQADERGLYTVSPRFEGWITRLYVNTTGASVARGQPLLEVYSPDLVAAQEEYRAAARGLKEMAEASPDARAGMEDLVKGGLIRLRNWDIAETDLAALRSSGTIKNSLTLRSPANGVVVEKMAIDGMRFMPGEPLFRIADLSKVWIIGNVFEQDLAAVRIGQTASVRLTAYPGRTFEGKVTFVYPTVQQETRTAQVRIELPNRDGLLKPDLYGTISIAAGASEPLLTVPDSAVLDSGTRQAVLVELGEGIFEPREVKLGTRGDGYVQVLDGLDEGEKVVVNGNFLIDAESNLKAALGSFGGHQHGASAPAEVGTTTPAEPPMEPAPVDHSGH
jgi:Cu(I)/Ag(I) efflux system membrane fusion protein